VVGNLGVEGFAGDGVDVCDELMLDGRAHHLRADYTGTTCDDDLHACCFVVCTNVMVCCVRVESPGDASSLMRGPLGGRRCDQLPSVTISMTTASSTSSTATLPVRTIFQVVKSIRYGQPASMRTEVLFSPVRVASSDARIQASNASQAPAS
jgi:hypothetical protein